jgi:ABC-type amino acid transport substrate-binding protein
MDRRSLLTAGAGLAAGSALVAAQSPQALAQAPAAAGRSRLQTIQQNGVIRCGTTGDFNPMSFRDPQSRELRGHQIDCAHKLGADLGSGGAVAQDSNSDILNALLALGYSDKEAALALKQVPAGSSVSDGIRHALKALSKA